MILLDTDHLSILEWEDSSLARRLSDRLSEYPVSEIGTTIVSFEEKVRGWFALLSSAKKAVDVVAGYEKLRRQVDLFCSMPIAEFDEAASNKFQELRKQHRKLGTLDLRIAAIAMSRNELLITRNLKDFRPIVGLRVEDWTRE